MGKKCVAHSKKFHNLGKYSTEFWNTSGTFPEQIIGDEGKFLERKGLKKLLGKSVSNICKKFQDFGKLFTESRDNSGTFPGFPGFAGPVDTLKHSAPFFGS